MHVIWLGVFKGLHNNRPSSLPMLPKYLALAASGYLTERFVGRPGLASVTSAGSRRRRRSAGALFITWAVLIFLNIITPLYAYLILQLAKEIPLKDCQGPPPPRNRTSGGPCAVDAAQCGVEVLSRRGDL